jgi:hypothetical protein
VADDFVARMRLGVIAIRVFDMFRVDALVELKMCDRQPKQLDKCVVVTQDMVHDARPSNYLNDTT